MFGMVPGLPAQPEILDVGCGSGTQTIGLARLAPEARITAVDIIQPMLDTLAARAQDAGAEGRIKIVRASMDALPFPPASFDLIWAEGSIFIIGIENGLLKWKDLVKPGGYLAFSELTWFTGTPSPEARRFFQQVSPLMYTAQETRDLAVGCGYVPCGDFSLPSSAWWDDYYDPMLQRINELTEQNRGNTEALADLSGLLKEIDIYRKYSTEYGYQFFLLKRPE
jgi:ubiquinone/menaquinone biosynthesis C-methylase UbiE